MTLQDLNHALASHRLETARRIGFALLAAPGTRTAAAVLGLHDALAALTDFRAASDLLDTHATLLEDESFAVILRLAEDTQALSSENHYRLSEEARQGLTVDEYLTKYEALAAARFAEAIRQAATPERLAALRAAASRCRRPLPPGLEEPAPRSVRDTPPPALSGRLQGVIVADNETPVAGIVVTLGLEPEIEHADPLTHISDEAHYHPKIGELRVLKTTTDSAGAFAFPDVPAGRHDFIAVTLDPGRHAIPTRFIARNLEVGGGRTTDTGRLVVREWRSAPPAAYASPHPDTRESAGVLWRKLDDVRLHNPFYYDFRRQALRLPVPAGFDPAARSLRVEVAPGQPHPFQLIGREVLIFTDLPHRSNRSIALYASDRPGPAPDFPSPLRLVEESASVWMLDTGRAQFRIAGPGAAPEDAPILAVRGVDARWRGRGRLVLPEGVTVASRNTTLLRSGPLLIEVRTELHLDNGATYAFTLAAHEDEPFLAVEETSPGLAGAAFEFSLAEFSGGRGFLHWTPEKPHGARHWWTLERKDALIARLPESIPWWIPPQGFGYALTPDSLAERDYIGVVSLRRGEWVDREFSRIAQGPVDADGSENRELDWPYPEMVGSSISMITGHTTAGGDAFFRFGCFDGERRWGLYVSSLEANEGPAKEIAGVQHAYSSPRLQEFKDWHFDVPDAHARPHVVASREKLVALRAKTRSPLLGKVWDKIREGSVPGPAAGLTFAVEGDPVIAWRKRLDLVRVADIQARKVLFGRDRGDAYSPVMGRPITPWAEEYDLIAPSGVFDEEEERTMRAYFILMGHMFMETDFMNWQFNARNANFEADRTDIVGAVGLVFDGHPDSGKFLDHVIELTRKSLLVYCTPGSGKWYENPACYYLQASKCRMNLVYHLVRHGRIRLDEIPRLKDFLRWGIVLLQPPSPVAYSVMRDGGGPEVYDRTEKIRKIPPIGDHASIGRWLPEHYATIGLLFRDLDPGFSRELIDAYFASNADGLRLATRYARPIAQVGEQTFHDVTNGATSGNLPLFFSVFDEAGIPAAVPALPLVSRRLEGFGAVFRHSVNTGREGYVLLKQGPGGYRFHRTEGSIVFFADGRPLVYDGGEAGETWRHSTLSFHDVHMPLASGHVERIFLTPGFHFSQGVHPGAIEPGKPVFLSDTCEHELVPEAYRRFRQEPPGVVRSLAWIDGRTLVIHDAIDLPPEIPSHWHLQVVGSAPSGGAASGYRFPGRFGTDLQVLFPGQSFASESVRRLPIHEYRGTPREWFAMQHLQVSSPGARNYLAVLHPVGESGTVTAEALHHAGRIVGVVVRDAQRADRVWFGRGEITASGPDHDFAGSSGSLLVRPGHVTLAVIGRGRLRHGDTTLESHGPEALLTTSGQTARLVTQGTGDVLITLPGKSVRILHIDGPTDLTFAR